MLITDAPVVLDRTPSPGGAGSSATSEALAEAAIVAVAPASALRVVALVAASSLCVTAAYLDAGALVRRVEIVAAPARPRLQRSAALPFHDVCAIAPGSALAIAGIAPASVDLVLFAAHDEALDEALAALAPGGTIVAAATGAREAALERAGLRWRRAGGVIVGRRGSGPGAGLARDASWRGLDRCACVDRSRVLAAIAAPLVPVPSPRPLPSWAALAELLRVRVDAGVGDPALGVELLAEAAALAGPLRALEDGAGPGAGVDVLFVAPHPDDETVYFGGTVARAAAAGLRVHVATLTAGEGGLDLRGDPSTAALADERRAEQARALEALGAGGCGQTGLGFADSGKYTDARRSAPMTAAQALAGWGVAALVDRLAGLLRELRPRAVLAMDPIRDPNYSLHAHHLACGAALLVAAGIAATEGPSPWAIAGLWTALPGPPPEGADVVADDDARDPPRREQPRVAVIPVDRARKLAALACYPSQRYSTARLSAALGRDGGAEGGADPPGVAVEAWIRRVRFTDAEDPIALLERSPRR
ncbi:MAG: PIG-L family deacetylase [Nannocystaceae bacterium]